MFRFSLATFLLVIALVSLVFAGLAYSNAYWVRIIATTTLATLTISLVAAIAWQKSGRWFWLGFAIVGWGYLLFLYYGGDDARDIFLTHSAVVRLDKILETSTPSPSPSGAAIIRDGNNLYQRQGTGRSRLSFEKAIQQGLLKHAYTEDTVPESSHFHAIGHYAWSLVLGCIGGAVSQWLYRNSTAGTEAAT